MKRWLGLLGMFVCVLSQSSQGASQIYNYSNDWDGAGVQGFGGVWYTQWAMWDQNTPSAFVDMAWEATNHRWIKADQATHCVYQTAIGADPNLKVVIGWQAPKNGTVNFVGQGSNWVVQSVYQIIDKNGNVLDSKFVNNNSSGSVSVSNLNVAAGDRIYFAYRPNSGSTAAWFEGWPIKIQAEFTAVNYRTAFITTPFETFEGNFDWSILEGDGPVTLSKQGDVKFAGNYAMDWHFNRQATQVPWTRGGKMFSATPMDWSAYSHVLLKFKSNSLSAAGQAIFWDFYQGDARVNGNSGCGSFAIPADTEWHTIALDLADFPRNNVTNLEFYTANDNFPVGTYDFYFDDIQLAIAVVPGDANNDGKVDVSDLGILAANYGTTSGATWYQGDFNHDGKVDVSDLGILAANYGVNSGSAADFNTDARAYGLSIQGDDTAAVQKDNSPAVSTVGCGTFGLPLIAGLSLLSFLLVRLKE